MFVFVVIAGCDGVDGLCINETSVDFNRIFFQVPRIYIELGGVGNGTEIMKICVTDMQRSDL